MFPNTTNLLLMIRDTIGLYVKELSRINTRRNTFSSFNFVKRLIKEYEHFKLSSLRRNKNNKLSYTYINKK